MDFVEYPCPSCGAELLEYVGFQNLNENLKCKCGSDFHLGYDESISGDDVACMFWIEKGLG